VVSIASVTGGDLAAGSGVCIGRTVALGELPARIDTVLVSGGTVEGLEAAAAEPLVGWLRKKAPQVRRMGSVCTGAFLLGAAGLLDGRRATTHWQSCELLRQTFPAVEVEPDAIFVNDGNIYTSAGVSAGIDLSLALVEQDLGHKAALAVARDLVLFLRRPGGQVQYSASLAAQAKGGGRLGDLLLWIADNPEADLSLTALADRAAMSERNFGRVFAEQAGMTPACYVECVRLDRAKLYLETTDWPLARVAERSGLGSVATLIRAFSRRIGITPDAYRQRFSIGGPKVVPISRPQA
jgi:transcriptional regulator GlxA family with amidase domain